MSTLYMKLIAKLKSVDDNGPPWGTLFSIFISLYFCLFTLNCTVLFERRDVWMTNFVGKIRSVIDYNMDKKLF